MRKSAFKLGQLVALTWIDSAGPDGWSELTEDHEPMYIKTAGWIMGKGKEGVTISSHLDLSQVIHLAPVTIPYVAIKTVEVLDANTK